MLSSDPILARFTNFLNFYGFRKAVATAFLRISKIPAVNLTIYTYLVVRSKSFVEEVLFPDDTNSCHRNLDFR